MVVDSVHTQDFLHYQIKLYNYDPRIYQYADLAVPPWQGRTQTPVIETLEAPKNLKGTAQGAEKLVLTWLAPSGAQWHEVQISHDGVNWQNLGRVNSSQMECTVAAGAVWARVRGMNDRLTGPWAEWRGDTTLLPPTKPTLTATTYNGGSCRVSWAAVRNATSYTVSLKNGSNVFYSVETSDTSFEITPEIQTGGPYRSLTCSVVSVGTAGSSIPVSVTLNDPAPTAPTGATVTAGVKQATVTAITGTKPADHTGYVIVLGSKANFSVGEVLELRQTASLPYTWTGLAAGTCYFRMAMRDSFFSLTNRLTELNFSAVFTVTIKPDASTLSLDTPSEEASNG